MTLYKTGPHCTTPSTEGMQLARIAPCIKSLDNTAPLREARDDAIRMFRVTSLPSDPVAAANLILAKLEGYRHPNLVAAIANEREPDWTIPQMQQIVAILKAAGVDAAGPGWATGAYWQADWGAMRAAGWCGFRYIDLHAYWANHGYSPWNALRWKTYWKPGDPQVLLGETGRDRVRDAPTTPDNPEGWDGNAGWKNDGVSAEQYVGEIVAFDAILAGSPEVAGAYLYTFGAYPGDPGPGHHDARPFDCDELVDLLLPHYGGQPQTGGDMPNEFHIEGTIPPSNYGERDGTVIDTIVIHSTRGSAGTPDAELQATINWFKSPASQVSAHLVIAANGDYWHCVPWDKAAYHAKAYNKRSIGIELVQQTATTPFTEAQYERLNGALDWLRAEFNIPLMRGVSGIVGHEAIDAQKSDPGDKANGGQFDWQRIGLGAAPAPPADMSAADKLAAMRDDLKAILLKYQ